MKAMKSEVISKRYICMLAVVVMAMGVLFGCSSKSPTLKAKEFEVSVNKDFSINADTYLKNVKADSKITLEKNNVDMHKLGTYDFDFKYNKKDYVVKLKVVDKEKPVITAKKNFFVFNLDTSVKNVNDTINKQITITDNYDKKFLNLNIINEIPKSETELVLKLTTKDSSNNVAEPVEIKVQFTRNGKEKGNLKQDKKEVSTQVDKKTAAVTSKDDNKQVASNNKDKGKDSKEDSKTDSKNDSKKDNSKNTNTDKGSSNKPVEKPASPAPTPQPPKQEQPQPTPQPPKQEQPQPTPQPPKPQEKPVLTVANCPEWASRGYTKLFTTYDEAYNWWNEQVTTEGSPHYNEFGGGAEEISDNDYTGIIYGVYF